MTYYNCAKFHCFSIFSFELSRGGQNDPPPLGTNVAKKPLNSLKVKDHDSPIINSLIRASNGFCFAKCMAEEVQRPDEHEDLF